MTWEVELGAPRCHATAEESQKVFTNQRHSPVRPLRGSFAHRRVALARLTPPKCSRGHVFSSESLSAEIAHLELRHRSVTTPLERKSGGNFECYSLRFETSRWEPSSPPCATAEYFL